eukprot:888349-Prorocentrum_minimum.AAC.4
MAICRPGIYVEYSMEYSKCSALNGTLVSTVDSGAWLVCIPPSTAAYLRAQLLRGADDGGVHRRLCALCYVLRALMCYVSCVMQLSPPSTAATGCRRTPRD